MIHALTKTVLSLSLLVAMPATIAVANSHAVQDDPSGVVASKGLKKFSFKGGPASELFAQVATQFPDFPVVLSNDARGFMVPGFEARISDPSTIVELVCDMRGECVGLAPEPVEGVLEYRVLNNELVQIMFSKWASGFMELPQFVEVLSIEELLTSGLDVEEILGTVLAGIKLQGESAVLNTTIRFHEETGVLFVKGTKSINTMVAQTIQALKSSAQWRVSDEALAAKEALIRSEALDYLEEANKEAVRQGQNKLEDLRKREEALRERARQRELEKDAALEKELQEMEDE